MEDIEKERKGVDSKKTLRCNIRISYRITYLRLLLNGTDKTTAYERVYEKYKNFEILRADLVEGIDTETLSGSGYCVNTLNTAI